jgi:flagellar biosynthesis anti-sigma factor FlgM
MKIDPNSLGLPQSNPAGSSRTSSRPVDQLYGTRSQQPPSTDSVASGESQDNVELSSLTNHLQMLASDSPEREARLEELSRLVEAGKYEVDSGEVSRRIIEEGLQS